MTLQVLVPDVGDAAEVEIIEILVSVGDVIEKDDSLVVLESDKASMEIPTPEGGKVISIAVKEGDTVDEGDLIIELEVEGAQSTASEVEAPAEKSAAPEVVDADTQEVEAQNEQAASEQTIPVPDVGGADEVLVTEILVKVGDKLDAEDSLVVLESDKASMEIPTPVAGEVIEVLVAEGAEVKEGDALVKLLAIAESSVNSDSASPQPVAPSAAPDKPTASLPDPQKNN